MGICAAYAFLAGSRMQRMIATALIVVAIAGAILQVRTEFQEKQRLQDRIRRVNEARKVPEKTE